MRRALARALSTTLSEVIGSVPAVPRPKISNEPRVPTAVRLPESVHRRLHEAAAEREVSANRLVVNAVSRYLDTLPPVEDVAPGVGS